jgi:hypothetical protein
MKIKGGDSEKPKI